jgi:hypothetical protein
MHNIKTYISVFILLFTVMACEKDGDLIYLSGHESSELSATQSMIILSPEIRDNQVLSLTWSTSQLSVSNDSMGVPSGIPTITLEVSGSSDFSSRTELQPTRTSYSFTGSELNTVATDAGLAIDVSSPLYFRIKSLLGTNMTPLYSNTITVNVTPYFINMSKLFILNKDMNDTLSVIYSPKLNGEYSGFVPATGWMNFYFLEGDGTIWGNNGKTGIAFELSDDTKSMWNCWFPENGGYYYVTMSTNDKEWTATWLPEITVGGDVTATLSYYESFELWAGIINPASGNAQITLSSEAMLYNSSTGDSNANAKTIAFSEQSNGELVLSGTPGTITVPNSGTQTLTLNLNDLKLTYSLTDGENLPHEEEEIPYLYLPGSKDGATGEGWSFDNFIPQVADTLYAGVVSVNSLWGFQMFTAADWGADYYTMGDAEGILAKNIKERNIPAPEAGTYLIKADVKNMTYELIKPGDVIYLSGLNDNWDFNTTLQKTNEGVYSGTIEVAAVSKNGFRIYVETGNWNDYYGGTAGNLSFTGQSITDDTRVGTYTLTVDLINETYEMTLN